MTASASSSPPASPPPHDGVSLADAGLLAPIPTALLEGRASELLAPVRFLAPGTLPEPARTSVDRAPLAAGLAEANAAYGHPRADRLSDLLADPATAVVVSGQQPGLFGGPLYALTKAVAAVLWAERLEAAGTPAVAVFWSATEDHDWRETSWAAFEGRDGIVRLDLGEDPSPLTPLGARTLGDGVEAAIRRLRDAVPGDEAAARIDRLASWYRPKARFGEAFARLLVSLLGERAPLVLDATLPAVKDAERPWLERLVTDRREVETELRARDAAIEAAGLPLQVSPQPGLSPLFLMRGTERRRVEWSGEEGWKLRGSEDGPRAVGELLETIADNPIVVSPGVLARPAIQDAVLGTTLQVLGPGEASYLPQVAPLYDLLGVAAPTITLRPQAVVLESHRARKLEQVPLGLAELVAAELDLDDRLAGDAPAEVLEPARAAVETALGGVRSRALAVDPSLEGPWTKTRSQVERAFDAFEGKLAAAVARTNEVTRGRAEDLRRAVRPEGVAQERLLSTAHFPLRHGDRFVESLFAQLDLDPRTLQVVTP